MPWNGSDTSDSTWPCKDSNAEFAFLHDFTPRPRFFPVNTADGFVEPFPHFRTMLEISRSLAGFEASPSFSRLQIRLSRARTELSGFFSRTELSRLLARMEALQSPFELPSVPTANSDSNSDVAAPSPECDPNVLTAFQEEDFVVSCGVSPKRVKLSWVAEKLGRWDCPGLEVERKGTSGISIDPG
jgi:hypothetical protein